MSVSALLRPAHPPPLRHARRSGAGGRGDRPAWASIAAGTVTLAAVFGLATVAARVQRGAYRPDLRAYHGAPPVIPHAVASLGRGDCLGCHPAPGASVREPLRLPDGSVAIPAPHDFLGASCLQCHLEQDPSVEPLVENGFAGAAEPLPRPRAYAGAPPVIPHGIFARSLCLACHGEGAYAAIRTSHPERGNCRQCHVADATSVPGAASATATATAFADNRFAEPEAPEDEGR